MRGKKVVNGTSLISTLLQEAHDLKDDCEEFHRAANMGESIVHQFAGMLDIARAEFGDEIATAIFLHAAANIAAGTITEKIADIFKKDEQTDEDKDRVGQLFIAMNQDIARYVGEITDGAVRFIFNGETHVERIEAQGNA